MDADVVIVGGGVIGTAIAWRAASQGLSVTLVDPDRDEDKASLVAAGMLGPVSESVFGEQHLLALNLLSVGRFPGFNQELEDATGMVTGLRTEGTLAVAYDGGDLAALRRLTEFRHSIGLKAEALDAKQCRALEPFLAPATRGGVLATGDLSVDNRRYLAALKAAAGNAGVKHLTGTVTKITTEHGAVARRVDPAHRDRGELRAGGGEHHGEHVEGPHSPGADDQPGGQLPVGELPAFVHVPNLPGPRSRLRPRHGRRAGCPPTRGGAARRR